MPILHPRRTKHNSGRQVILTPPVLHVCQGSGPGYTGNSEIAYTSDAEVMLARDVIEWRTVSLHFCLLANLWKEEAILEENGCRSLMTCLHQQALLHSNWTKFPPASDWNCQSPKTSWTHLQTCFSNTYSAFLHSNKQLYWLYRKSSLHQ